MAKELARRTFELPDRNAPRAVSLWFSESLNSVKGWVRVVIYTARKSVSQEQRGYYHGHIVEVLADFLEENKQPIPEGLRSYHDFAHAYLKLKCLSFPVFDKRGNLRGHVVGSTSPLNTEEMFAYVERCRAYMWDTFRLMTNEPDPNWRKLGHVVADTQTVGVGR